MLPLYTCYSASHAKLFELMSGTATGFDLRPTKLVQRCESGVYKSAGWGDAMLDKMAVLIEACLRHEDGSQFVYSDVDVVFNPYADPAEHFVRNLGGLGMAAQNDGPAGFCTGLFICHGSPALTAAWMDVRRMMADLGSSCDQTTFNCAVVKRRWTVPVGLLTSATSLGAFCGFQRPVVAQDLVNAGLKDLNNWAAFHASWCKGADEKYSALRYILSRL